VAAGKLATWLLPCCYQISGELQKVASESTRALGRHGIRHQLASLASPAASLLSLGFGESHGLVQTQVQLISALTPVMLHPLELGRFRLSPSPLFEADWEASYGRHLDLVTLLRTVPSSVLVPPGSAPLPADLPRSDARDEPAAHVTNGGSSCDRQILSVGATDELRRDAEVLVGGQRVVVDEYQAEFLRALLLGGDE
jgi:hypothetical protein